MEAFLLRLARLAWPRAQADLEESRRFALQELGLADLMPWDMGFAAERLRRPRHAPDSGEIRRHLPLDRVMAAPFDLVGDNLIARMLGARQFQSGLGLLRQAELALFDPRLHASAGGDNSPDPQAVLEAVRDEIAVVRPPEWHRFAHAFSHIFAGGYAAGYYSYLWAERLSADAYAAFGEPGADRAALGARFRDEVLARGGSRPAAQNFLAFRGRRPVDEPLLANWGIAA
nr:M3 family metallopeptidase [Novosphingobium pokkalii]